MTEAIISSARRDFMRHAKPPEKELQQANAFLTELSQSGQRPSARQITQGRRIEQALDVGTEQFSFWAAINAGQSARSESEMQAQLASIETTYKAAKDVVHRLQTTLKDGE